MLLGVLNANGDFIRNSDSSFHIFVCAVGTSDTDKFVPKYALLEVSANCLSAIFMISS